MNHTPQGSASTPLQALIDALLEDREAVIARFSDGITAQLPLYGEVPTDAFAVELGLQPEQVLRASRDDRQPGPEHQAELLAVGQRRALQGIHPFAQLGLRPAIVSGTDVDQVMSERYLAPLGDSDSAAELLATLGVYFACGMHVDTAAQRLFVHPNTLRYRLGRFEKLTGADLHDAQVAFEVWWAGQRSTIRAADDLVSG